MALERNVIKVINLREVAALALATGFAGWRDELRAAAERRWAEDDVLSDILDGEFLSEPYGVRERY